MSLQEKLESIKLLWDQSTAMETAWKYNIDELDVAEADEINIEQALQDGRALDWYDINTHEYIGTW